MVTRRNLLQSGAGAVALASLAGPASASGGRIIEVLGHRGAPALRPEHTLASYAKAIADGADFIEPDLQITKDGRLVALHEAELSHICDVAEHPEFAARRRKISTPFGSLEGWFIVDFTLPELKTLRLKERIPKIRPANTVFDGEFTFLCFEDIIDFVAAESATRGRLIGIVPELKMPALFASAGLPLEDRFLDILSRHSYLKRAPLIIQCFEVPSLQYLRKKLGRPGNVRLMQLIDDLPMKPMNVALKGGSSTYGDMITPQGLKEIASYAEIISPDLRTLIPLKADGFLGAPHPMIKQAHQVGLTVFTYEFRPENQFIAADFHDGQGDNARNVKGSIAEMHHYLHAGLDGFFTDDPAIGRLAVDLYVG